MVRPMRRHPLTLLLAALAQAVEAVGLGVAAVQAGLATAAGHSDRAVTGVALTAIAGGIAVALAVVAVGLARGRGWSRTPALFTDFFVGIVGIYLLEAHRYLWGAPALALALVGFVAVVVPPTWHTFGDVGPCSGERRQPVAATKGGRHPPGGAAVPPGEAGVSGSPDVTRPR